MLLSYENLYKDVGADAEILLRPQDLSSYAQFVKEYFETNFTMDGGKSVMNGNIDL